MFGLFVDCFRVNDILLSVNDVSCENVTHSQAVEILKSTPNVVRMVRKKNILLVVPKRNQFPFDLVACIESGL